MKAKVSPLKKETLSKLDLQAAFIGTRLKFALEQSQLSANKVYAWTDSMTTMQWITNSLITGKLLWQTVCQKYQLYIEMRQQFDITAQVHKTQLTW